jgi:hypothetical protein
MKALILISLFVFCLQETKVVPPLPIADIFSGVKKQIYECVSSSSEASQKLKQQAKQNLESNSNLPLNFHNIELTQEDREVIRKCKRDAFRATTRKPDNNVTPISLENIVHKKKISVVKGSILKPRKLGMLDGVKRLGAFNVKGIFTCLEQAQPGIKVLRDTVNLWKSRDFTGAVINIYDNFQPLADGITVCINSIFPA